MSDPAATVPFVTHLAISHVRILRQVAIDPAPQANLYEGPNAAGKTSLLEGLHILARGRSFRESQWRAIIAQGESSLRITARVRDLGRELPMGIEHDRQRATIRINGEAQRSAKALVEQLPLQLIHPDSHRLIEQGPAYRRQYLDWGVFHVEHRFFGAWQRYRRALKQRNAGLRAGPSSTPLEPWEQEMAAAAAEIDRYRSRYVQQLAPHLERLGRELLQRGGLGVRYLRGWRTGELGEILRVSRESDQQLGHTRAGPHRADLDLMLDEDRAAQRVSRGQQKALVFALILAQVELLRETTQQQPGLLVDDLCAELDEAHLHRVWEALRASGCQLHVAGTDLRDRLALHAPDDALFHVEHGQVTRVL